MALKSLQNEKESPHYKGHRERLKERFLKNPENLPDYELLEMALYYVYKRQDTKPMAKKLLENKTLLSLLSDSKENIEDTSCSSVFILFNVLKEFSKRLIREEIRTQPLLNNAQRVVDYCRLLMAHLTVEQFHVFFLDRKYYLILDEVQHKGTLDETSLYPREVMKKALSLNAAALILAHNHPSGDPTPSKADIELTEHLKNSLWPFNIQVLDHFIIGKYGHFSFRAEGLLK